MKKAATRAYRQTARAEAAAQTRRNLIEAAVDLWRRKAIDEITLDDIASEAGTTRQTLLRHFGSKDGLLEAMMRDGTSIDHARDEAPVGDIRGALDNLLEHYERDGDAGLQNLQFAERSDPARRIADHGRAYHRAWCARVFEPFLPSPRAKAYDTRVDAFVAATDLYLWKLLRRDLGRTAEQTAKTFETLVRALAEQHPKKDRR